jgi:hypothetical protein
LPLSSKEGGACFKRAREDTEKGWIPKRVWEEKKKGG